jgi:hypothetical protein
MSHIPHQAVPAEPKEEDIPVCALDHRLPVLEEFPTALQECSPDPIQEIPLVHKDTLFEYQCRDPIARHQSETRLFDPTWKYDCHGILGHRKPSEEVEVYVPPAVRSDGPCAIIYAVAEDGSDLTVGVFGGKSARKFTPSLPQTGYTSPRIPVTRPPLRLLTRAKYSPDGLPQSSHVGLAVMLTTEDRNVIQTGKEQIVTMVSSDELRNAQAADDTCQRLLTQTSITSLYDLSDNGLLVRVSPRDGSQQVLIPKTLVSRILTWSTTPLPRVILELIVCSKPYVVPIFGRGSQKMYTKRYECATSVRKTASRKIERLTLLSYFPQRAPWNRLRWTPWDLFSKPNTIIVFDLSSQTAILMLRRLYRSVR